MVLPFVREYDDLAAAIANPPPNRPIAQAIGNFGRGVCDAVGSNPGLYAPTFLQYPIIPLCKPYWDGAGYDAPALTPTTGGQCADKSYTATWERRAQRPDGSFFWQPTDAGTTFSGPVTVVAGPDNGGSGCSEGFVLVQYQIQGPGGQNATVLSGGCVDVAPGYRNLVIAPTDGGNPSECGDGAPVVAPGPNPPPNTPGPPPGTGPTVDPRGEPIFVLPPSLPTGPTGTGPTINLPDGEINLGGGTGNGPAAPPLPAPTQPGAGGGGGGAGGGGGDNDFGPPPAGERWVGCCVNITASPTGERPIPSSVPQDVYPQIIGNVRLRFKGSNGLPEYDTPLSNRQKCTCVWEPVRGLAPVGIFVNLLPFYDYTFTPYSVPLEQ